MSLHLVSMAVLLLLGVGLVRRRDTRTHVLLMGAAIAVDLGLLLFIEGTRHAVKTAATSASPFILIHAGLSLVVVAAYVSQIVSGWRRLEGKTFSRNAHAAVGVMILSLRVMNFVTGLGMAKAAQHQRAATMEVAARSR